MFELIDAFFGKANAKADRRVFRFTLRLSHEQLVNSGEAEKLSQTRLIPSVVKLEVYKGECVICKSRDNLHFDHDFPYSRGGSSLVAANVRLLCARHNPAERLEDYVVTTNASGRTGIKTINTPKTNDDAGSRRHSQSS